MATASRNVRKVRRFRNERRLATQYMEVALSQRDQARLIAMALEQELKRLARALSPETIRTILADTQDPEVVSERIKSFEVPKPKTEDSVTMTKIEDEDSDHTESIETARELAARDE